MQDFRKLRVWESARTLAVEIYRLTSDFPESEIFGLTAQLRRAAISVGANIAEGAGRDSGPELRRFLIVAMGSASEAQNHLLIAQDLGLVPEEAAQGLIDRFEVNRRMMSALITRVSGQKRSRPARSPRGVPRQADNREPTTENVGVAGGAGDQHVA